MACLYTACTLLALDRKQWGGASEAQFYLSDLKQAVWQVHCETGSPFKQRGDRSGEGQVKEQANKMYEFSRIFDSWHPGLNQLKTFKRLSFHLATPDRKTWKAAIEL